jgi:hypothetical protein
MARPDNLKRFSRFLAADAELHDLESALKRNGDHRKASIVSEVRSMLADIMACEQEDIYLALDKATR